MFRLWLEFNIAQCITKTVVDLDRPRSFFLNHYAMFWNSIMKLKEQYMNTILLKTSISEYNKTCNRGIRYCAELK